MRLLLIGATGQIGFALTNALSKTPHHTSVLVRDARKLPMPANVQVREAKTFTPEAFEEALYDVDGVIYGVGVPLQPTLDNQMWERLNFGLLKTFLEVLGRSTVRRLIYVSTVEVLKAVNGVVQETHPLVDPKSASPYCLAMLHAYQMVKTWAAETNTVLTTIHPVALYGGLNTGFGLNNYMENLLNRRSAKVPMIVDARFPVVHAESLASAIVAALAKPGAFLVSDEMTSLKEIAHTLHSLADAYVPPVVPVWVARSGAVAGETLARLKHTLPIMTRDQIDFMTSSPEPKTDHAQKELGWDPMSLDTGIRKYLQDRTKLLALIN